MSDYLPYYNLNIDLNLINTYCNEDNRWSYHGLLHGISLIEEIAGQFVLQFLIDKNYDYSFLLNGCARSEIARTQECDRFLQGTDYLISFKTFIPAGYKIDNESCRESIFQVHQSSSSGSPPLSLGIDGNRYYIFSDIQDGSGQKIYFFDNVSDDKNKWTDWTIRYLPSDKNNGVFELYKNGELIVTHKGPNAYPGDNGYLKLGLYKWGWTNPEFPESVTTQRVIGYKDIVLYKK